MSLRTLVDSLKLTPGDQLSMGEEMIQKRIICPAGCKFTVRLNKVDWRLDGTYNLHLNFFQKKELSKISSILAYLLQRTSETQFTSKEFIVKIYMRWPEETLLEEHDFSSINEVGVHGSFYSYDPTKVRIGYPGKTHELKIELKGKRMQVWASGDYKTLLPRIMNEVKPRYATIRLSASDAQRSVNGARGLRKWILKYALRPKKRSYLAGQMGGGITFGEKEMIETTILASTLKACAEALGKPLAKKTSNNDNFHVILNKTFSQTSQILPALQSIVRIMNEYKTGKGFDRVFNQPLLTISQAKELLEKEIDLVKQSYENMLFFGINSHKVRGSLVKRLAQEHFGDSILIAFENMNESEYLSFLQGQGFQYDGKIKGEEISPVSIKERYLLEFFCQSYANDPRNSIDRFQRGYVNSLPTIKITGNMKIDAANVAKLSLPKQALLQGIDIDEVSRQGEDTIRLSSFYKDGFNLYFGVSLDSCKLLDFQEEICERMGVVCN